jgi:hypothetical protein
VLISGLALAGLFVSKMSAPLIALVALALLGLRLWRGPRGRQSAALFAVLLAQAAIVLAVIWASFDFRYEAFAQPRPGDQLFLSWPEALASGGPIARAIGLARDHRLLPEAYLFGYAFVNAYSESRAAFWNGASSVIGWPGFFPYAFAVKTPLPELLVLALAILAWRRRGRDLYRCAPLWVLLVVYWGFALSARVNIGHRHLLPIYPVLFILAGAVASFWERPSRLRHVVTAALVALAVESLSVWPDDLSYFNQTIGPHTNAYHHLVDSSLDWGQELPALARYLDEDARANPQRAPVYLSYFGVGRPAHYGIDAERLPSYRDPERTPELRPLRGGVYCISATMLQLVYSRFRGPWNRRYEDAYQRLVRALAEPGAAPDLATRRTYEQLRFARLCAFLRAREPDAQVHYAILVYRLSDEDVRRALEGPPPPGTLDEPAVRGA